MRKLFALIVFLCIVADVQIQGCVQANQSSWNTEDSMKSEIGETNKQKQHLQFLEQSDNVDASLDGLKNTIEKDFDADSAKWPVRMIKKIKKSWKSQSADEKVAAGLALSTAVSNVGSITNAKDNPLDAFTGVLNLIATFGAVAGPTGQFVSVVATFIASIISLFGTTKEPQSVRTIVRKEMRAALDAYDTRVIKDKINAFQGTYRKMKTYLQTISKHRSTMTVKETEKFINKIPMFKGTGTLGILQGRVEALKKQTSTTGAKKCLKYLELYLKLDTLRDMILLQVASLAPTNATRKITLDQVKEEHKDNKGLMSFLYDLSKNSKVLPYYDGRMYPFIETYMKKILRIRRPIQHFPASQYCLANYNKKIFDYFYDRSYSPSMSQPAFGVSVDRACTWRFVHHGNNIYSIVNKYGCPKNERCNALLSYGGGGGREDLTVVTVEHDDPVLWEIKATYVHGKTTVFYRIIPRYFCDSKCGQSIGIATNVYSLPYSRMFALLLTRRRLVGCIGCRSYNVWRIYNKKQSDTPYNVSTVDVDSGSTTELEPEEELKESGSSMASGEDENYDLKRESHDVDTDFGASK